MLDENGNRIPDGKGDYVFNAVPTADWGSAETLKFWREQWAVICNAKFEEKGLDVRIDHRSYERQGVELFPTRHEGPTVRAMEKKGIKTEKGEFNRWIRATNAFIRNLRKNLSVLLEAIKEIKAELDKQQSDSVIIPLQEFFDMRNAKVYSQKAKVSNLKELKPIVNGLQKIKFDKTKAKYKAEHEKELKQYYAVRRKFLELCLDSKYNQRLLDKEYATLEKGHAETYAKFKAVMKQKGESGEYLTTNPPYGYMKDPDNPKRHWVVDDEAADIVRQIFAWCMEGFGPSQIAKKLKEAKVDCPTVHWMKLGRNAPAKTPDNPYNWAPRTITGILEKQEYLGHMVNFKTRKQSYKSKKKLENPPDQWKIFENTHEAIIDEETFARVQELRKNKRRPTRTGKTNMFSGLVRCADCGEKLYYCTSNSFETRQDHFVCSTSRKKGKEVCDTHFIRAVVLEEGTLQHMRLVIQCVAGYEDAFRRALGAKRGEEARSELSAKKRTLQKSENRLAELDRLFKRIYEDMVNGHRVQDVTISYNYIGILPANLLYDVMNGKAA